MMPRERIEKDDQPHDGGYEFVKPGRSTTILKWLERYDELARSLKIDKEALDDELIHQPELYHEAGRLYQSAVSSRDEARVDRDSTKAKVDLKIRGQLERQGDEKKKPTETQIGNMVSLDPELLSAQERYQEWDRLAGQGAALREDFHARGFTLRELANLWVAGYYQTNSAGRSNAMDRRADEYHRACADEGVGIDRHRRRPRDDE
jgi:hypothetical protein